MRETPKALTRPSRGAGHWTPRGPGASLPDSASARSVRLSCVAFPSSLSHSLVQTRPGLGFSPYGAGRPGAEASRSQDSREAKVPRPAGTARAPGAVSPNRVTCVTSTRPSVLSTRTGTRSFGEKSDRFTPAGRPCAKTLSTVDALGASASDADRTTRYALCLPGLRWRENVSTGPEVPLSRPSHLVRRSTVCQKVSEPKFNPNQNSQTEHITATPDREGCVWLMPRKAFLAPETGSEGSDGKPHAECLPRVRHC